MTPTNVRFEPNPNFEHEMKRELDAKAQRVVDDLIARYRADSSLDLHVELAQGLTQQGINLPDPTLDEWTGIIARGNDLKVDIHIA